MAPSGKKEKKVEVSFTNWILGGSLLSVTSSESSKKGKHTRRKTFIINEDGVPKCRQRSKDKVAVKAAVDNKKDDAKDEKTEEAKDEVAVKVTVEDKKNDAKDEKAKGINDKDEKKDGEKMKGEKNGKEDDDTKGMKWCKICKIPSPYGTEDTKPEGARKELCTSCGKEHWIKQAEEHGCDDKKGDEKKSDEKKGDEKKGDEKKGDEKKGDEKKGDDMKDGDGEKKGTRTSEQDKTIKEMKASNKSWKDIAAAVGATKNGVIHRFKELKKAENEPKPAEEKKPNDGGAAACASASDSEVLAGLDDLLASLDTRDAQQDSNGGEGGNQIDAEKEKTNNNAGGGVQENKNQGGGNGNQNTNNDLTSNSNFNSGNDGNNNNGGGVSRGPQIYGKLKADGMWTKDDCDLLEHLMERYEGEKWLHMQAGFYNWTGRMVAAEFIEKKFKNDGAA